MNRSQVKSALHNLGFVPFNYHTTESFMTDLPFYHHASIDVYATQSPIFGSPELTKKDVVCFFMKCEGMIEHVHISATQLVNKRYMTNALNDLNRALYGEEDDTQRIGRDEEE